MILQTAGISQSQKAAIEEPAGRRLQDLENVVLSDGAPRIADATPRENALLKMRHQLALRDLSQRRMSIEEWMASLMGEADAELTA
jgi:hypothetical protein